MDDLDRVFQRLVQNIRVRSPEQLTLPFTVAELYEQIIPYRHNRRELGIETNQDYEIAVMRLLSGERDYIVGDEAMQDTLRKELTAAEPDTGTFREFATAQISIAPEALEKKPDRKATPAAERPVVAAIGGAGGQMAGVAAAPAAPAGTGGGAQQQSRPPAQSSSQSQERSQPQSQSASQSSQPDATSGAGLASLGALTPPEGCRYCTGTLPEGRQVKFCPHCGQNLSLSQCPACGTEMEQGWKFCIGCGRPNS